MRYFIYRETRKSDSYPASLKTAGIKPENTYTCPVIRPRQIAPIVPSMGEGGGG